MDDNDTVTTQMSDLNIKEIEIVVEYDNDQEYEAEIELKDGAYTSELEDEINNIYLKGQVAFDNIYPMVEKLDLNEDSTKEEVFDQVLNAFDLDNDYKEIEVEITFYDSDKEIEYEEKN